MKAAPAPLRTGLLWATLAFSLACGAAGQSVLALRPEAFAQHWFRQGPVLLAVHLSTLGFLTALVFGVLTQFTPMLLGRSLGPLGALAASLAVFALSSAGLWTFFAGRRDGRLAMAAALGIWLASAAIVGMSARPLLCCSADHRLSRLTLASALFYLLFATGLGGLLAQGLVRAPLLPGDPLRLLELHVHLGLFGFGALTVFAVSYELLPMFNLAKGYPAWPGWLALGLAHAGLLCLVGSVLAGAPSEGWAWRTWPAFLASACLAYVVQVVWIFRRALRPQREPSPWLFRLALLALLVCATCGLRLAWGGLAPPLHAAAYVYLGLFGFLGGAIFSQLQKIVPLIAWYDRFAPHAGKAELPAAGQLLQPQLAWLALPLYAAALLCGLGGFSLASPALLRLSGLFGCACFLDQAALVLLCRMRGSMRPLPAPSRGLAVPSAS